MKAGMNWVVGLFVIAALVCGAGKAEAVPVQIVLNDTLAGPNEYFSALATDPGTSYQFSISYWIDTAFQENGSVATNHDAFYYALLSSSSSYVTSGELFGSGNYQTLLDNASSVDIFGAIPQTQPISLVTTFTADQFLFPLFLVDNGNPDFSSTVHIDYEINRVVTAPVPEPSTILLFGAGMLGLFGITRRRT